MAIKLNKSQRDKLAAYETFFQSLENKYNTTREEIMNVVLQQGLVKSRIETYFLVKHHLSSKQQGHNTETA